jgi:drug/metabolite transporter (DMT)-like permease
MLVSRGVLGALGTAAYYLTLPKLGAGKATLIGNTWVIWAALLAVPMLGELLTWRKLAGMLLALFGIAGKEKALAFGAPGIVAILLGITSALRGQGMLIDFRTTLAIVAWVVFGAVIQTRITSGWRGRQAAWMTVIGCAATFDVLGFYLVS